MSDAAERLSNLPGHVVVRMLDYIRRSLPVLERAKMDTPALDIDRLQTLATGREVMAWVRGERENRRHTGPDRSP